MTDPVTCPHCREHLDIPTDLRGKAVRCASCQNVFTPPAPADPSARRADVPPRRTDGPPRPARFDDYSRPPRRQGNGGVWAALLLVSVLLGGIVAGCVGIAVWMYNPPMHPFTSAAGRFQVEFPADPTPAVAETDQTITVTAHRGQTQERFVVKSYPLPDKFRRLTEEEKLTEVVKSELAAEGAGAETQRQTTTHDGFAALDVMAATGGGVLNKRNTILRGVLAGQRVYVVIAQGPNLEPQVWWVRKFFTSFTVTDPAVKKPAEKEEAPRKQD